MTKLAFTTHAAGLEFLGCRAKRTIGNNTVAENVNGDIAVYLHGHLIARLNADGSVAVRDAGWWTVTTKERINQFLRPLGARVWSKRGVPTITQDGIDQDWRDAGLVRRVEGWHVPVEPFFDGASAGRAVVA